VVHWFTGLLVHWWFGGNGWRGVTHCFTFVLVLWPAQTPRVGFVTFCLDTKSNQKNQDKGHASTHRPDSQARNPLSGPALF